MCAALFTLMAIAAPILTLWLVIFVLWDGIDKLKGEGR